MATKGVLHDYSLVSSPWVVGQFNDQEIEDSVFFRIATKVSGVPVVTLGSPTAGTWQLAQVYRDTYRAEFICTVAGTPGTWIQLSPAVVTAYPGSPLTGYWVLRTDLNFGQYYWDGATWIQIGGGGLGSATPQPTGTAAVGVATLASREDHVHALGELGAPYPNQTKARLHLAILR